jgi:hypothetical protein
LRIAKAMTSASRAGAGTTNETHWSERAAALLAPLLHAAWLTGRPVEDAVRWTLRQDLTEAMEILTDAEAKVAKDVLTGIERTDGRERSSIFSAAAGVLSAYNSDGARQTAANPNFDAKLHIEMLGNLAVDLGQELLELPSAGRARARQTSR